MASFFWPTLYMQIAGHDGQLSIYIISVTDINGQIRQLITICLAETPLHNAWHQNHKLPVQRATKKALKWCNTIGADSMGVIAPTAKKLWRPMAMPLSSTHTPTEIVLCRCCTQPKGTEKINNVSL